MRIRILLLALALGCWAAPVAAKEPSGFGGAEFGMTAARARELLPKLEPFQVPASPGAAAFPLTRYVLYRQALGGMPSCNLYFQFYQDQLFKIEFYCGNPAKSEAYLRGEFGAPSQTGGGSLLWGEKVVVELAPSSGVFSYSDKARADAVSSALYVYSAGGGRVAAENPPTPAPTRPSP